MSDTTKDVIFHFSPDAAAAVDEIVRLGKFPNEAEATRRAISDELFFQKAKSDGWDILIAKPPGFWRKLFGLGPRYKQLHWS